MGDTRSGAGGCLSCEKAGLPTYFLEIVAAPESFCRPRDALTLCHSHTRPFCWVNGTRPPGSSVCVRTLTGWAFLRESRHRFDGSFHDACDDRRVGTQHVGTHCHTICLVPQSCLPVAFCAQLLSWPPASHLSILSHRATCRSSLLQVPPSAPLSPMHTPLSTHHHPAGYHCPCLDPHFPLTHHTDH